MRPASRWAGRLVGSVAVAALLMGMVGTTTRAQPNPFGGRRTVTTVVLHRDGSYDATLRQTQELVREYSITFGGGVHDGFRLPDDGGLLPPYLRAAYALTDVTVTAGQPEPADFTRTNHLVTLTSTGTYPEGTHQFAVGYRVTGAAVPTDDGWDVHVRLLDVGYSDGDRVEFRADELEATGLRLRCITHAPDTEPCGTVSGPALIDVLEHDGDGDHPPEYRIEVDAENAAVTAPTIDHR